jgi:hypothetical protein
LKWEFQTFKVIVYVMNNLAHHTTTKDVKKGTSWMCPQLMRIGVSLKSGF